MKRRTTISIKQRIYWSFSLLVFLFMANAIITILTLNSNKKLATNIFNVLRPTIQTLDDFNKIMLESKMYTTNWVYLRTNQEDKILLKKLHDVDYAALKARINVYSSQWKNKNWLDSLNRIYTGFEELLAIEKNIMGSLKVFSDYDDPVTKLEAERKVEEEILPRTAALMTSLNSIRDFEVSIRTMTGNELERSSVKLRILIIVLAITIILAGLFLSMYMTKVIINPVNRIRHIINNLGRGIIKKIDTHTNDDEIGRMVNSVNNLSEKLQATAMFAREIGLRNFDMPFKPLSDEDTLGKALIEMRENIRSSDEKLNIAQHIAHVGSWERDMKTDKLILSDEMFKIFDIDPLSFDFLFPSILKFIHPDDMEYAMDIMRKNHYMDPVPFECRIITSKGLIRNVVIETKLLLGGNAEIQKTFGIVQDITERKHGKEKLAAERELLRTIIENIPDQIYFKDAQSRFLICNMPVAANAGYISPEKMIGKTDFDLFEYENAKQFYDDEQKLMLSGTPLINQEEHSIDKTGVMHWNLSTKVTVKDATGKIKGLIGIGRDITKRKIAEELLQKSEAFLEKKNKELEIKNRELEQFAYVASHDLQEPLRTTSSFVELLQKQYAGKLDEKADKYLTYIIQSSDRMKVLIKDLLDYSRIGNKKELIKIDCDKILHEVLDDLKVAIVESKANIETNPLPFINGHSTEIKLLFQNLIINAVKFRKKNIIPQIKISSTKNNGYWEYAIEDNGIGIEEQHLERIFIIFQRLHTRNKYKGSGIGLSHCKKIVELHGGRIWAKSKPGIGTTFYFTMPADKSLTLENNNIL